MIENLKEGFLQKNPDYCNDVNNFIYYLDTQVGKSSFYNEFTIRGMTTKGILDSLIFNVERQQIKKKETAKKYTVAIGQLFEYILENSDIENISLRNQLGAPSNRKDSYTGQCMSFINDYDRLLDKESYSALNNETVISLIKWCDNEINKRIDKNEVINERICFKRMAVALCIKLILFTGITYRVARSIPFSDLDIELNIISINGYKIRLPLVLSKQFKCYKEICSEKNFNIENGFLFVTIKGDQWGERTSHSGIPNFLKTQIGQTDITSIVKYGITQLMLQDVNDSVIIQLTGASKEMLSDCSQQDENGEPDWYTYINSKIINTSIYKKL